MSQKYAITSLKRGEAIPVGSRVEEKLVTIEHQLLIAGRKVACRCDCGKECSVQIRYLLSGRTKSCGCLRASRLRIGALRMTHGMTGSPEFEAWGSMRRRCGNPRHKQYADYGGRGITVCDRWQESFENFYADMGPKPSPKHSLERKDNNAGYSPENCIWATAIVQGRNRRTTRLITSHGESLCLSEWESRTGISKELIYYRLKAGWSPGAAVSTPPHCKRNPSNE